MAFGTWTLSEGLDQVAQYEEEDEDQYILEDPKKRTKYQIRGNSDCLKGESIIIAVGNAANSFLETYVQMQEEVAEVVVISSNENTRENRRCKIYKEQNVLMCLVKYAVEAKDSYEWIRTVMSQVKVEKAIVLCSSPKSTFVSSEETRQSDEDILRRLGNTAATKLETETDSGTITLLLEEGNMLKDLPAAVMCYCETYEVPCVSYVAFTESHYVDVFTLKCFQQTFNDDCMSTVKKVPQDVLKKRLRDFEGCGVAGNNVYI